MSQRQHVLLISAILVAALMLRAGVACWWQERLDAQDARFSFGDSESYWVLAHHLAKGEPYEYGSPDASIFRVPLYPALLSLVVDVDDPNNRVLAARLLGCLLGTISVGGIMLLCNRLFDPRVTLIAGVLAALHPGAVSMSIFVLSEAPFCPLMIGNLLLWRLAYDSKKQSKTIWFSALAGITAGLCVLVRPSWLLFAPFACVFQMATGCFRKTVIMFVVMMVGFSLTMSPWWIRNHKITGRFVLTTLQVGPSMYDGLHPGATGASDTGMGYTVEFERQQRLADSKADVLHSTYEYRLNKRMGDAAKAWAFANPVEVIRLAFVKVWRIWRPWPTAEETSGNVLKIASAGGMAMVVLPALIGLWWKRSLGWNMFLLAVPAVYFTCLHAVFIGSMRYRLPAVLLLVVVAAPVWAHLLTSRDSSVSEEPS